MQDKGEVGQDLHEYIKRVTEGENRGKYQCNLCGKISTYKSQALMHVESIHFPGTYEYQCDYWEEKFDTRYKWLNHRNHVHSSKKSK